jgi:hypothetical protein
MTGQEIGGITLRKVRFTKKKQQLEISFSISRVGEEDGECK